MFYYILLFLQAHIYLNRILSQQLQNSSLLVFANKQDVKGALSAAKVSEALGLTGLKDKQWHIQVEKAF
jgi:signal recognition particle receptor subunit beta